jgi:hypothetical protein
MSRRWLLDLDRSVRRVLAIAHGGTGNEKGYATAVVQPYSNGTGATLPLGTVVATKASFDDRRVVAAPTEDGTDVLGVVVGSYEDDDGVTFSASVPSDHGTVAVMTAGTCPVLIASAVTRGHYAYVSSTDGQAKSSASLSAGAFGRFIDSASSGSARVALGVHGGGGGSGVAFGTPALTLGTSNAAGAGSDAIRTDASVAVFDGTAPVTQAYGDSAATGAAAVAARRDHRHGMPSAGSGVTFGTPALALGTANAAGSTDEAIRRDATILAFDVTNPTTQGFGDAAAIGTAAVAARRDHVHGMPSATDIVDSAPSDKGWFGDGSDGAGTFDGSTNFAAFSSRSGSIYTLSRDTFLTSCTVDSGVTVDTNGYHFKVRGTLTNDGTICRVPTNGANGGGGGALLAARSIGGGSGKGGDRVSSSGNAAGQAGNTNTTLGFGGAGGAGGQSSGGGAGGAGGAAPAIAAERGNPRHLPWGAMGWILGTTGSGLFLGGAGGGAGGTTGILGSGGGGGGGGGVVIVSAHKIANGSGVIHADGGAGGNGVVNVGWGGGGGGGGGGVVVLVYNVLTGPGTIRASGGAKGTAPGGAPAMDGSDGSAGKVVHLVMS